MMIIGVSSKIKGGEKMTKIIYRSQLVIRKEKLYKKHLKAKEVLEKRKLIFEKARNRFNIALEKEHRINEKIAGINGLLRTMEERNSNHLNIGRI